MATPQGSRPPLTAVVGTAITHQVAFCGPLGVGKTTAVAAASSSGVARTEADWSVTNTLLGRDTPKRTTTVGIDYGEWENGASRIALYGTPGQERFTEARNGALHDASRVVLWLYGNSPTALEETAEWLELLRTEIAEHRVVVAVTRLDEPDARPLADFQEMVHRRHPDVTVVSADPRSTEDVRAAVSLATGMLR